ncbi:uncharacterized protein isoform X2 [Rhodnius prolixus]
MREKSAHQRNLPTLKEWPLSLKLQMPKMYQKPVMMNRRHLESTLDKPNVAAYTPNEEAVIPIVSNSENNVPNSEEMQTEENDESSTENFSLKEILHNSYLKYINASYYDTNNIIMYLNGNKENEARNSAPSNIPPMEINNQFNTFTPNVNNYENYSPLTDVGVTDSSNHMLDNNANLQTADEIPNSNSNPSANSIKQKKIPQYSFVDGQYVREDVTNLEKPQERANEVRKETQYTFVDGQYTPEEVNLQNRFSSNTENQTPTIPPNVEKQMDNFNNQTPTIPPNVEKQMDNFNNQEHNMVKPIFVTCYHPIFAIFIENIFPHYQVNLLPPNYQQYQDTIFRVWVPQW